MTNFVIATNKQYRASAEIFSTAKTIIEKSQSTREAIAELQELIDTSAYCNLTARELLGFYQ